MKNLKLYKLYKSCGVWVAVCEHINTCCVYSAPKELRFFEYNKKEVIQILRHNYNCVVPRGY